MIEVLARLVALLVGIALAAVGVSFLLDDAFGPALIMLACAFPFAVLAQGRAGARG